MSILTSMTRMWLTRSVSPFIFKNEHDDVLDYSNCDSLGLYIHIPFCMKICSFCPYCKELYDEEKCNKYIDSLIEEIRMTGKVGGNKKKVTSLYFGGGTPALAADRIGEIISETEKYFIITEGIGVELHPENVNEETLIKLKNAGVTKISIGIQSFQEKFLSVLERKVPDISKIADSLKKVSFETVSMDFIFALPKQNFADLKSDIDTAFSNGANHVAVYPFIDFSFTESRVKSMKKKEKKQLLDSITRYCASKGYKRDSIWTFSNAPEAKYSSMTRESFLGFGCSATTLLRKQFKINTFSVEEYESRIENKQLPTSLTIRFTVRQRMLYFLFWTLYSTELRPKDFESFFRVPLKKVYGFEFWLAKTLGFLTEENGSLRMTLKGAFYYHYYESYYTLSYIDKMWSIMRKEAFPKNIRL